MAIGTQTHRLKESAKKAAKAVLARRGLSLVERSESDIEPEFWELFQPCANATMTGVERMYALYKAVQYVVSRDVPGDVVECGVWRGGSSMLCALTLNALGDASRHVYLYDTFAGMPAPTDGDVFIDGAPASSTWAACQRDDHNDWCYAALPEVRANMATTGFPEERTHFVPGKVEETIPAVCPTEISLLRLDTDFYESTRHELNELFPRLSANGVLIVDDYGAWAGARQAVDEYFLENPPAILLNRLDYTGRIGIKS